MNSYQRYNSVITTMPTWFQASNQEGGVVIAMSDPCPDPELNSCHPGELSLGLNSYRKGKCGPTIEIEVEKTAFKTGNTPRGTHRKDIPIYRALILLAFWNDDSSLTSTGVPHDVVIGKILRLVDYTPLDYEERKNLQISIFRCQWCTMDRVLNQVPDLMNLTIQRHWVNAGVGMSPGQWESLARFMAGGGGGGGGGGDCTFEGTGKNNTRYTLSITPFISIKITNHDSGEQHTHPILDITNIPDKLLNGDDAGFNEDDVTHLEILRMASGFARSALGQITTSVSREATQQGIHTALVENSASALTTLLKIDEYVFRSLNTSAAQSAPYSLPTEHFRTAVRVARNDPCMFQLLVRASAESVPPDDPEITQWAMDLDDAFGHWLLDLMLHLPQQIETANANPVEGAVFYLGRANGQVEMARRYMRDVLDVEELSSWMEEPLGDVSGWWKAIRKGKGASITR
ncbi:hypothetical protein EYZ11_000881 [Aspergillus tanneri]|uniref:Uncharacterized protein n=1 Tax=Aspergillus tanneri TaxID=1220188 RepID=A0A4S3JVX7_9EURO|nr:hypothetical protein EYZ11_000881 [Aspergillus tanneri]